MKYTCYIFALQYSEEQPNKIDERKYPKGKLYSETHHAFIPWTDYVCFTWRFRRLYLNTWEHANAKIVSSQPWMIWLCLHGQK